MVNQYPPWTENELTTLREMAGKYPATVIGKQINHGEDAVRKKIAKLGLARFPNPNKSGVNPKPPVRKKAAPAPVAPPVKIKTYVEPREGLRQPPKPKASVNYPPMEICPVHKCWVSDWAGHAARLGCTRPTA